MTFVVDSYALFEGLVDGNQDYRKYFEEIENSGGFTTPLFLLEFYHGLYHQFGEREAGQKYAEITTSLEIISLDEEIIKSAGKFRSGMLRKKKKFSYADAVGYVAARRTKTKLLTGDEEFRGMEGVVFVK